VEPRSQVDLPAAVGDEFEVFVNGVPQRPGVDFERVGRSLRFAIELRQEGRLGFWRWVSLYLGVAGTYRQNDTVDVVYRHEGARTVAHLEAKPVEARLPDD
jgi:hypothetical protein